jgi:hypothetical protein
VGCRTKGKGLGRRYRRPSRTNKRRERRTAMRRTAVVVMAMALTLGLGTSTALAANAHFKHGSPTFTVVGSGADKQLNGAGTLAGLGNGDIVVELKATADPTATCTNGGQHQAPGQNPAPVELTGTQAIPGSAIKNGNASFSVLTAKVVTPVSGAPDCPNPNWTEDITDLTFTSATITVYQPCTDTTPPIDCTVVLSQTFPGPF